MFAGVLRQLKHVRHALATEKGLEQMIRINVAAILFVLEPVLLNVLPQFFGHLGAGKRLEPEAIEAAIRGAGYECKQRSTLYGRAENRILLGEKSCQPTSGGHLAF